MADPPSTQDSAKSGNSDKDLDSRQTAMDELKDCVRQLDEKTMPQFLDQVSEARDSEASRNYAISLYSEVARVHKGGIIPFIPRIMASIVRSLPSSGNSQQLHLACAKVITSVARYTIDPTKPLASNQDLLRSLCIPLLSALSTKLEPLSVGAAVCLQALVESEKWKFSPLDLQDLICAKATSALAEKGTQTVAHMNLMRSLSKFNRPVVQKYAASLLRSGLEILKTSSGMSDSWQYRAAAAQLLGSVLKVADAETLQLNLSPIFQTLEGCLSDKVAGVRTAAGDALKTAKIMALDKDLHEIKSDDTGSEGLRMLQSRKHLRRKGSKLEESGVQELQVLSDILSPNSDTPSLGTASTGDSSTWSRRSPLFPVKQSSLMDTFTSCTSPGLFRSSESKENAPAMKLRGVLLELPASSKLLNDLGVSPGGRMLKELSSTHQDGSSFNGCLEDSASLGDSNRICFSHSQVEDEDSSAPGLHGKLSGNCNATVEAQLCTATTGSGTMGKKRGKGCQHPMNDTTSQHFAEKSGGDMAGNTVLCTDGIIDAREEPCKDGNLSNTRSVEDVLCNHCTHLLTSENTHDDTCESMVNSESKAHIEMEKNRLIAEDHHLSVASRCLVCSLPSSSVSPRSKRTSLETLKDCMDVNIETMSDRSWSIRENPISCESEDDHLNENRMVCTVSQQNKSIASSSCCSLEELASHIKRDAKAGMQCEGQCLSRTQVQCKCLSAVLDNLDVQAGGQCLLSDIKESNHLLSADKFQIMGGLQADLKGQSGPPIFSHGHSKLSMHLDWKSRSTGELMWSVLQKMLEKAQSLAGTCSGGVICAIVILVVAYILINHLSNTEDLNVLVPT